MKKKWLIALCAGAGLLAMSLTAYLRRDIIPLVVNVPARSMSKLPFVIAEDQGLYSKYGLDVELRMPDVDNGINRRPKLLTRIRRRLSGAQPVDLVVNGQTPAMVWITRGVPQRWFVSLGSTDCAVRYYVIARPGIDELEDLAGRRLGVGADLSTAGFAALRLMQRMGWVRDKDITLVENVDQKDLTSGKIDAYIGGDEAVEAADDSGFTVLLDTRQWNEEVSGNSILVAPGWLDDDTHREAARRFLKATIEGIALYYARPDLALDVMKRWNGVSDPALARTRYARSTYLPRKPYSCTEGIRATMNVYDSPAMRKFTIDDLRDDSLVRELDQNGFIEGVYASLPLASVIKP